MAMTMALREIARAGSSNISPMVLRQSRVSPSRSRLRCRKWMAKSTDSPSVSELSTAMGMS